MEKAKNEKTELENWLDQAKTVFPSLKRKKIIIEYKGKSKRTLGYVKAQIHKTLSVNPETLFLGKKCSMKIKRKMPEKYEIAINTKFQNVEKKDLREQIVQYVIIHELLHIENKDIITISKQYKRRKKKKIHTSDFEKTVLGRYNLLREKQNLPKIQKSEHINIAINKILHSNE